MMMIAILGMKWDRFGVGQGKSRIGWESIRPPSSMWLNILANVVSVYTMTYIH